jgi:LPXTG-motif cell wall-anchored protein
VYGASANPAIGGTGVTQAASGSGTGAFTAALSGLAASTPYHVRAYAINSEGTSYGDDVTFTTLSAAIHYDTEDGGEVVIGTEAAWSGAPSNIKGTLFWTGSTWVSHDTVAHMYFTDLLGARLMDYTDVAIPAAAETSTQNGIGFVAEEYSYQAAAADGSGTYQYTGMKYTVTQADGKKIILLSRGLGRGTGVSYLEVFMENQTSGTLAIRHGSVLYGSAGTAAEAAALDNPATGVMGLLRTADVYWFDRDGGSDMGGFTLSPHTDVRPASLVVVSHPLLTNQVVRFDLMFMSSENALYRYMLSPSLTSETFIPTTTPTVATNAASGVTASGATLNGNVTSDGGATVTARGFVYGSAADPAIGGAGVIQAAAGTGTGAFTANISGLAASTTYHVRAYAINSEGTAYGTDRTFTTQSGGGGGPTTEKPTVITNTVTGVTASSATLSGNVTASGGATVTARGFVYGSAADPAIGGTGVTQTAAGTGTGSFTANVSGLTASTTYHVRAYATNSEGTSYGADVSFTTSAATTPTTPPDDNDPDYISRTLTDNATGITVSGSLIHRNAALTVNALALHAEGTCAACDEIRQRMADDDFLLLVGKDISLSYGFQGSLTITIPVGSAYNGDTVTILHCANGTLQTFTATVKDGKATFTVTSLSPFAVFTATDVLDNIPKTGDGGGFPLGLGLSALGVLGFCLLVLTRKRRRA